MIPLAMMCFLGGCLDLPIDTRQPERQIKDSLSRQFPGNRVSVSCYVDGIFYRDCLDSLSTLDEEDD